MPVTIRAHNILCLIGFEGCGYSEEFVANMKRVKSELIGDASKKVRVLDEPDALCRKCPNLRSIACYLRNQNNEEHMRHQDQDVAKRLGIQVGKIYFFSELLDKVRENIKGNDLKFICGNCPWLSLGVCAKKREELGNHRQSAITES